MHTYGSSRRGTNGVGTSGVSAHVMFFDRGAFAVLPVNDAVIFPKVPWRTFFPKLSKVITFCSGPISVDPICPQPTVAGQELTLP